MVPFPSFSFQDASTGSESVEISASSKDAIPGSTLKPPHTSPSVPAGSATPTGSAGNQQAVSVPHAGVGVYPGTAVAAVVPSGTQSVSIPPAAAAAAALGRPAMPAWQRAGLAVALLAGGGAATVALTNVRP